MARRSKTQAPAGRRTSALAGFSTRFLKAFGTIEDPLEVSEILGKLGRRDRDPAVRRRAIAARIAVLSIDTPAMVQIDQIAPEAPEPVQTQEALVVPENNEPQQKKAGKTKVVKTVVALDDTTALFEAISLSDVAKKPPVPDEGAAAPTQEAADNRKNTKDLSDGFEVTNTSAQKGDDFSPDELPLDEQASNSQSISSEDVSHAIKQSTSKVLNVAAEVEGPAGMIEPTSIDPQLATEDTQEDIQATAPKAKRRRKTTVSFDLSALSELEADGTEETEASPTDANRPEEVLSDAALVYPYPLRDITPDSD